MSTKRFQDSTRFKKTYSFARQSPIKRDTLNSSSQYGSRDVTRFRKTYDFMRNQPVALAVMDGPAVVNIDTESGNVLSTEAGDHLQA
jgi:hypothetical protein